MARPARPERSRSALPLRQLSRFCYLINSDMVFGTHSVHHLLRGRRLLLSIGHDYGFLFFVIHVRSAASVIDLDERLGAVAQAAALGEHGVLAQRGDEALQLETG